MEEEWPSELAGACEYVLLLLLPLFIEGKVEFDPRDRSDTGGVIMTFDAAARWAVAREGYGRAGISSR